MQVENEKRARDAKAAASKRGASHHDGKKGSTTSTATSPSTSWTDEDQAEFQRQMAEKYDREASPW